MNVAPDNIFFESEILSQNILSDDRSVRKNSRIALINLFKDYKKGQTITVDQQVKYPWFNFICMAINKFIDENELIFKVEKEKEAGSILEKGKERKCGIHTSPLEDSNLPIYLVTMPHLAMREGLETQIKLIFEEGFLSTREESIAEAKKRLHLFIGINYCYDLDPLKNKANKKIIRDLFQKNVEDNVSIESFCWSRNWTYAYEVPKNTPKVTQTLVKRVFRLLHEIDSVKAANIYNKVMKTKVNPLQACRDEIIHSPSFMHVFKACRSLKIDRTLFLATVDDDAVALRTAVVGLYSQYDQLIQRYPNLEAASTGYYMFDPLNKFVEIGSVSNFIARYATGLLRANGSYLPEPNAIFKITSGKVLSSKLSFMRKDNKGSLESIGMLENLGLMKGDVQGRVVFGGHGPLHTGVSPNVKIPSHLLNINTVDVFKNPKNLSSLRSFSQSSLHPLNGFTTNILRTCPEGSNYGKTKSFVSSIYTAFDPIDYAVDLQEIWLDVFPAVFDQVFDMYKSNDHAIYSDPEMHKEVFKKRAEKIVIELNLDKKLTQSIASLIRKKFVSLFEAKLNLATNRHITADDIELFVKLSRNINMNVYKYLRSQIMNEPFNPIVLH